MNKAWDATGVAFQPETWAEVLRVLKPGAHLLAFGGPRTYHRMTCAIEDAGFEIRDSLHWLYGSGYPKSHNLQGDLQGWGTALKPGHEPIVLARKPLGAKTVQANQETYGVGALNIQASRIGSDPAGWGGAAGFANTHSASQHGGLGAGEPRPVTGRWPANVLFSHSATCGEECSPDCPVLQLDLQSGITRSRRALMSAGAESVGWGLHGRAPGVRGHDDQGGASRFFQTFDAESSFYYCPKPTRQERDAGCEHLEDARRDRMRPDLDPEHPTGLNADPKWGPVQAKNVHPTVKPVRILEYLINLTTTPDALVLDPFTGSGSTGVASLHLQRRFIGIELTEEYFPIAQARLDHAQADRSLGS